MLAVWTGVAGAQVPGGDAASELSRALADWRAQGGGADPTVVLTSSVGASAAGGALAPHGVLSLGGRDEVTIVPIGAPPIPRGIREGAEVFGTVLKTMRNVAIGSVASYPIEAHYSGWGTLMWRARAAGTIGSALTAYEAYELFGKTQSRVGDLVQTMNYSGLTTDRARFQSSGGSVFTRQLGTWTAEGPGRAQFGDRVVEMRYRDALRFDRNSIVRQRVDAGGDASGSFVRTVTTMTPVGNKGESAALRRYPWGVNVGVGSGGWTEVVTTRTTSFSGMPAWSSNMAGLAGWSGRAWPSAWGSSTLPTLNVSPRYYDSLTRSYSTPPPMSPPMRAPIPSTSIRSR